MRVLVTGHPLTGEVRPMLPLATAARRTGHEVVVATRGEPTEETRRHGLRVWRLDGSSLGGAVDGADAVQADAVQADAVQADARRLVDDLAERVAGWRPDVLVHHPVDLGASLVAVDAGLPAAAHSCGPAVAPRLFALMATVFTPLYAERGRPDVLGTLRRAVYLDVCPPSLECADAAWWPRRAPLRPAGPGRSPRPDVVDIVPGDLPDPAFTAAALAAARGLGLCAGTRGRRGTGALVVTHGAADVVLAALAAGVPLLLAPRFPEEQRTADLCARAGAAVVLAAGERTTDAVRGALARLRDDPTFGATARRLAAEIAHLPAAEDVLVDLERGMLG
ncbi:hypothetical protein E1258_17480 [Micromonospora sp. KC207]|uniref:nucleotide disphospho-sugar-binding domain-containing protein n=1 Tax=Micromonospora sp. KC207 TaxID=2530377 RepID=UPI00104B8DAD|nr:nucleotide disphospho-sugar-binding domain-containing protein [Micromonospora sp. KC207]TDC59575.1 hypothetical protein E1258_17480 [Micromonospora sp. KC207]